MGLGMSPNKTKTLLESNPLKSRILLGDWPCLSDAEHHSLLYGSYLAIRHWTVMTACLASR